METDNLTFKVPSGFEVTIREQNGDDDGIISQIKNTADGSAINKFVAAIVLKDGNGKKPSANDILLWKNKDKYYVLLRSRILSLGAEITYTHICTNNDCKKETPYEENLELYNRDFSLPLEDTKTDFKYQVTEYPNGQQNEVEFALSSGKKIKYKYLNGLSEKKLLALNKDELNKNTELTVRDIQWFTEEKWQPISNFKFLTAREMSQIRKHIAQNDMPFDAISEVVCPYCKTRAEISLMTQPDFFFPQGT